MKLEQKLNVIYGSKNISKLIKYLEHLVDLDQIKNYGNRLTENQIEKIVNVMAIGLESDSCIKLCLTIEVGKNYYLEDIYYEAESECKLNVIINELIEFENELNKNESKITKFLKIFRRNK